MGICSCGGTAPPEGDKVVLDAQGNRMAMPWMQEVLQDGYSAEQERHESAEKWHNTRREAMMHVPGTKEKIKAALLDNKAADAIEAHAQAATASVVHKLVQGQSLDMHWREQKDKMRHYSFDPESPRSPPASGQKKKRLWGENMRKEHFLLQPFFLNPASYGATPIQVLKCRALREAEFQKNPVYWRFTTFPSVWSEAKCRLANFIGCDSEYVQIMHNANACSNTVLKSLPWHWGDKILIFSTEYEATELACDWLADTYGVRVEVLQLTMPMTDDEVLRALEAKLEELRTRGGVERTTDKDGREQETVVSPPGLPKLVNFCHVTSKTAWIFPAKAIVKLCHKYGVPVLCDGAQAAGHLDFELRDIGADYYVGTVHKWMYSCPGVAFLVVQPHKHICTAPQTVSYFAGRGFDKEFSYYGLQDWSVWLSVIDGLDFVEYVCGGWDKVRAYCRYQARNVHNMCMAVWKEKGLEHKGPKWLGADWCKPLQGEQDQYGQMPIIPLPWAEDRDAVPQDAVKVMGDLLLEDITAFLLVVDVRGTDGKVHPTLGIRCPCQIYHGAADWKKMAVCVSQFNGKYGAGEAVSDALGKLMPFLADTDLVDTKHRKPLRHGHHYAHRSTGNRASPKGRQGTRAPSGTAATGKRGSPPPRAR